MNRLLSSLQEVCELYPLQEKILIVPGYSHHITPLHDSGFHLSKAADLKGHDDGPIGKLIFKQL